MSHANRPQSNRSSTHAVECQPLEARQLCSATYSAVNLGRFLPTGLSGASQITNSGLIAYSSGVYSVKGHHFYPAPAGYVIDAINDAGDDVRHGSGTTVIDFQGQSHSIFDVHNVNDDSTFEPTSINAAGQVAGTAVERYHPQNPPMGSFDSTSVVVYDAAGNLLTSQGLVYVPDESDNPQLNDAGTLAFNAINPNADNGNGYNAEVTNVRTQAGANIGAMFKFGTSSFVTSINQSGQVGGFYFRGRSVSGLFFFDAATDTLRTIPSTTDRHVSAAAISDDGTMVGTVSYTTHRRKGRIRTVSTAVLFNANGSIEDLNSMATLPPGASLTAAISVNDSGEILTECTLANGTELPFLLTPKS